MAYIYAYAQDEADCENAGLVGALFDKDAVFDLQAGEFGELMFRHPIDPWDKWKVLQNGVLLKTAVPVRLVPEVDDGAYVSSVDIYKVSAAATKYQRYIYYAETASKDPTRKVGKSEKTKHKKLLKRNTQVAVIGNPRPSDPSYRYKVRVTSGKKKVTGYMEKDALTLIERAVEVPENENGLENISTSYSIQDQLFRIYDVQTVMDGNHVGELTVYARRLVYDLLGNVTTYKATSNVSCQTVCRGILENTVFPHPFTIFSDIANKHVGIDSRNMNAMAALIDPDNGVVGHWGGEVVCDDYDIYLLHKAGKNRGVRIRYGTNMQGVSCEADYSNVITSVRPVGETSSGAPLYLDGHRVNNRDGYNYNSSTHTNANNLPTGFRLAVDDNGSRKSTVIERDIEDDGYATPRCYVLEVSDAKVTKQRKETDPSETSVLTTANARVMLAQAAVDLFNSGCDMPDISMDVDFTLLGDTEEYAQYRHLESMFVYDSVEVLHNRLNISGQIELVSIKWDIRKERVTEARFGSLGNAVAKIPGYSLPSINGSKIISGSITGGQLGSDSVSLDHMQANSVNTDVLMARSITGEKIQAGEINAEHLAAHAVDAQAISAVTAAIHDLTVDDIHAGTVEANTLAAAFARLTTIVAQDIDAGTVTADTLTAAIIEAQKTTARTADFDVETVTHLIGSVLQITGLIEGRLARIDNLYVTQANLANAVLDRLALRGTDGLYYDIAVGSDGMVTTSVREITQAEISAGETSDGKGIVPGEYDLETLTDHYIDDPESGLKTLYIEALSTGKITAQEAFIGSARVPELEATVIRAIYNELLIAAEDAVRVLLGNAENYNATFDYTQEGLRTRVAGSKWSTLVTNDGYHIDHDDVQGHVGSFHEDTFEPRSIRMGGIVCKASSGGGWVWKRA